ncbi:MAG: hypothetical protein A2X94_13400 [Bdellovibrionales bacterium GWB1_55_8]|nr:MAG: hypothetical protein A2X94_13400 [Bdellovibrionales bacterium GWB1_55_8]
MDVLIIEDVDPMLRLLELVFNGIPGVRVSGLAKNGWDARVEISRRRPDLILLDEILPGESGAELLEQFEQQSIPVILLTSLSNPVHGVPKNALGRLVKPGWRSVEQDRSRLTQELKSFLDGTTLAGELLESS